nr:helix-turn-helix domain-containing protein [Furfurilactobacillus milii]
MDQALPRPVKQTLSAVQQGATRTEIAQQRRLKPSTINEHLLTAAILLPLDQFPYEECVDEATRESIEKRQPVNIDNWQGPLGVTPDQFFQYRMTQIWETKQK